MPLSEAQQVSTPMSMSASTRSSSGAATAWRNKSLSNSPMSLSSKTAGTTFKFDDTADTPLPSSDKGKM